MLLGYNTNGFAHHRFDDCVAILADLGYGSVAITLDHHWLSPFGPNLAAEVAETRRLLARYGLRSVVETGARFLLNPRVKHEPTLISPTDAERRVRIEFLARAIDLAADLESDAVSFWAGRRHDAIDPETCWKHLVEGCRQVAAHAARRKVKTAFEPEPGMFIETMDQFAELIDRLDDPAFGLTLDVGHLHCVEQGPIPSHVRRWRDRLSNVHIEDMRRGVHEHLMFGQGEIDFGPVIRAFEEIDYTGALHVELSRHSHMAPEAAAEAYRFLAPIAQGCRR
jgi:sugar phosphate isomerase/epimerase